jgi:hypothetical protein
MNYQIEFTKNPTAEEIQSLGDAISENAPKQKGTNLSTFLDFLFVMKMKK